MRHGLIRRREQVASRAEGAVGPRVYERAEERTLKEIGDVDSSRRGADAFVGAISAAQAFLRADEIAAQFYSIALAAESQFKFI